MHKLNFIPNERFVKYAIPSIDLFILLFCKPLAVGK